MKQKRMTVIAIACGLICAACVAIFMMNVQGEADAARAEALARFGGEQVEACVATRDIVAGERVDLSAVETKLWVADLLPERAVRANSDVVGKTPTSTIFKGEVITTGRFEAGQDAIDVPAGKQAVSVPAKAVQAVGGAIHAGMSVDIYSSGDAATTAIASGVNVLDTSMGSSNSLSSDGGWITIAVEPEKVQELISASSKTTLYFTLPGEGVSVESEADESSKDGSGNDGEQGNRAGRNDSGSAKEDAREVKEPSMSASTSSSKSSNVEGGDK